MGECKPPYKYGAKAKWCDCECTSSTGGGCFRPECYENIKVDYTCSFLPCGQSTDSGDFPPGAPPETQSYDVGEYDEAVFKFKFTAFGVPDRFVVGFNNTVLYDSGYVSSNYPCPPPGSPSDPCKNYNPKPTGPNNETIGVCICKPAGGRVITVTVFNNPTQGTGWGYTVYCATKPCLFDVYDGSQCPDGPEKEKEECKTEFELETDGCCIEYLSDSKLVRVVGDGNVLITPGSFTQTPTKCCDKVSIYINGSQVYSSGSYYEKPVKDGDVLIIKVYNSCGCEEPVQTQSGTNYLPAECPDSSSTPYRLIKNTLNNKYKIILNKTYFRK